MRAVVRRGGRLVVDGNVPAPQPQAGQVLAKSLACGICGSDLHALDHLEHMVEVGRRSGSASRLDAGRDVIFGHEFCAEIVEHGPQSPKALPVGTRVVAMPFCAGANGMELVGFSNTFPGAFAEQLLLTEHLLLPVPNGLPDALAAMTEPFAVGEHAVERAGLDKTSVVLVLGCGPVGIAVVAAAKARGIGPVIACDFSATRRAVAERLGADILIDPAIDNPHGRWSEFNVAATLAERGMAVAMGRATRSPVIFECVGVPGMLQAVIEGAPPASRVVVVGACMEADRIEPLIAINKQLSFEFVFAYTPEEFATTLRRIADGDIDVGAALTKQVGLDEVPEAFALAKQADRHVKIMVDPRR